MSRTKLLAGLFAGLLFGPLGSGQTSKALDEKDVSKAQFVFSGGYVLIPKGPFLLVRKGRELGAIRFSKIERDGQGNGKGTYESYFQSDGSGSLLSANVVKRSAEIDIKPMKGIHSLAWQPGQNKLWVGRWWFGCQGPSLVNMTAHFSEKDQGYEFAPTAAEDLREIDASDDRLRWRKFDPNARIEVPVSDLPTKIPSKR